MKFAKVGIIGAMQEETTFLLQDMDNARGTILGQEKVQGATGTVCSHGASPVDEIARICD